VIVRQMTTVRGKRNFEARVQIMRMRNEGVIDAVTAERLFTALDDAPTPEALAAALVSRSPWSREGRPARG
jgi:hypothetical protein